MDPRAGPWVLGPGSEGSGITDEGALGRIVERYRAAFGKRTGDPGYDAALDLNSDGKIEVRDFVIFLRGIGN